MCTQPLFCLSQKYPQKSSHTTSHKSRQKQTCLPSQSTNWSGSANNNSNPLAFARAFLLYKSPTFQSNNPHFTVINKVQLAPNQLKITTKTTRSENLAFAYIQAFQRFDRMVGKLQIQQKYFDNYKCLKHFVSFHIFSKFYPVAPAKNLFKKPPINRQNFYQKAALFYIKMRT